jgi:outer membrane protein insertion porin family
MFTTLLSWASCLGSPAKTMSIPLIRYFCLTLLCVLATIPLVGVAQQRTAPAPTVASVDVDFAGFKNISEQYVRGNIKIKIGDDYDQAIVDDSVKSLYRTQLFEFIEVVVSSPTPATVGILFKVKPKYRVENVFFEGNERASDRRLLQEITIRRGQFIDEYATKRDADKIKEYYIKRGFSDVKITYDIDRNIGSGMGVVSYTIDEGVKIRVKKLEFIGNEEIKSGKLRGKMETKRWGWFSWLTGSGKFEQEEFRKSVEALIEYYQNEGYLDVEVDEENIEFVQKGRNLTIRIPLSEGRQYRLGTLSVKGNTVYTDSELLRMVFLMPGMVFSPEKVDEAASNLEKYYGSQGYLESRVRAERVPNVNTGRIDIVFDIYESEKVFVENLNIQGNTTTKTIVILRELALAPGDVFDMIRMENSKLRLENSRYFESVNVAPEETNIPGRKNLRVIVEEGRTGNFTFGAGFSSLERASFFTEISMGNFDLFNWRSFFQGDGQKFRVRVSIGSRRNETVIEFQEPWLFEKRLAFGIQLYREETDRLVAEYDQQSTGLSLSLRQRLFELVEGVYSYRLERIELSNVSPALIALYGRNAFEPFTASRVGFQLLRDTRNRLTFTSSGDRFSWFNQVSGSVFGGDIDNWRTEIRVGKWIPTFQLLDQSFSVLVRAGSITALKEDQLIRPSERYYLGGPDDLRGFDYRKVGPKTATGGIVGGRSFGMVSMEYAFQLSPQFQFVTFYDWGFVNERDFDFSAEGFNDNAGIGIRILVMGAPMRLDYGIPLTSDGFNDEGGQFHFTFGTRF